MSILRLQAEAKGDLSARDLMVTVVMPALAAEVEDRFAGQPGMLALQIDDDTSAPVAFSVDLERREAYEGAAEDPDCLLRLSPAAFGDLLRGRLQAEASLEDGAVRCFGDPEVLVRFAETLERGSR